METNQVAAAGGEDLKQPSPSLNLFWAHGPLLLLHSVSTTVMASPTMPLRHPMSCASPLVRWKSARS